MAARWWVCGEGHVFRHDDQDWHAEHSEPGGAPISCGAEDRGGEPCGESSHLWGPHADEGAAVAERGRYLAMAADLGRRRHDPSLALVAQTYEAAIHAGIRPRAWTAFLDDLGELCDHNRAHYEHGLRVGLYAYRLAVHEGQRSPKFALYGGCGHDLGKCEVANEILNAKAFGPEEFERIKEHVLAGFAKLKDSRLFTAFIAGLHHLGQPGGYGIDLRKDSPIPLSEAMIEMIMDMAEFIRLVDFFDALTTRADGKGLLAGGRSPRAVMDEHFPGQQGRIGWLFANRILPTPALA